MAYLRVSAHVTVEGTAEHVAIWERRSGLGKSKSVAIRPDELLTLIAALQAASEHFTPAELEREREAQVASYKIRGTDSQAFVTLNGRCLEQFDNRTTTDTEEPSAFRRALTWAQDRQLAHRVERERGCP